jgi:hypothetical protein
MDLPQSSSRRNGLLALALFLSLYYLIVALYGLAAFYVLALLLLPVFTLLFKRISFSCSSKKIKVLLLEQVIIFAVIIGPLLVAILRVSFLFDAPATSSGGANLPGNVPSLSEPICNAIAYISIIPLSPLAFIYLLVFGIYRPKGLFPSKLQSIVYFFAAALIWVLVVKVGLNSFNEQLEPFVVLHRLLDGANTAADVSCRLWQTEVEFY